MDYASLLGRLLERGTVLIDRIRRMKGIGSFIATDEHQASLENFKHHRNRRYLMLALKNADRYAVKNYVRDPQDVEARKQLPPEILEANLNQIQALCQL